MSNYTTQLRFICEFLADEKNSVDLSKVPEVIERSREKIFSFDFPIFDENYRATLETKIIKHFYFREIGFETYGRFKFALDEKMNLIMPYYNEMYKSALLEYNPLYSVDYYTEHTGSDSGNEENEGTRTDQRTVNLTFDHTGTQRNQENSESWNKFSDTPQGSVQNIDLVNNAYLTNATNDNFERSATRTDKLQDKNTGSEINNGTLNGSRTFENTDEYLTHIYGKMPGQSYSTLIKEFRETLLNIDQLVISELNELFMLVF